MALQLYTKTQGYYAHTHTKKNQEQNRALDPLKVTFLQ